jgi:probable addiction module antidote protein
MRRKSRPYEIGLHQRLRDTSHAISYINAAAGDSIEGFLLALRDFAEATKGMSKVAADADKNRENLYRTLSEEGNPRLDSLLPVLEAMGLRITVTPLSCAHENVVPQSVPTSVERPLQKIGYIESSGPESIRVIGFPALTTAAMAQWGRIAGLGQNSTDSVFSSSVYMQSRLRGVDQPPVPAYVAWIPETDQSASSLRP